MLPAEPRTTPISRVLEPPAWLRVGTLDHVATRQLRDVLSRFSERPGMRLVVDLEGVDDGHALTVSVLLGEASRSLEETGGSLVALCPQDQLARALGRAGVRVLRGGLAPVKAPGTLTIAVGRLPAPPDPAATAPRAGAGARWRG